MAAGIRYSITLTRNAERHVAISRYIEQHCIHDGRGIRLQPLIEKLFYEFARSGLSPDEICDAIRAYEANMAHKAGMDLSTVKLIACRKVQRYISVNWSP